MSYPWIYKANKIFQVVLIGQFVIAVFIASLTDTWVTAITIGLLTLALPIF